MARPLSGTPYELHYGDYTASIASIGASLRSLSYGGRDLVVPFDVDEVRPAYRGASLAPWPNRIAGGAYTFAGAEQQVPLTEPERGNALHGLACWLDFGAIEQTPTRVTLGATIVAQPGYPHRVDVEVAYELGPRGLQWSITGANAGADAAPWGTGPHPYLVAGPGRVDDWTLELPADAFLEVTPDRLLPIEVRPVTAAPDGLGAGAYDFREARPIGDTFIDHAFTVVSRGAGGEASVEVRTAEGSGVAISWDSACPWVQVHTGDQPVAELSRIGLAVEPMTCPPDAFNSGVDLVVLAPGESHTAGWVISAL